VIRILKANLAVEKHKGFRKFVKKDRILYLDSIEGYVLVDVEYTKKGKVRLGRVIAIDTEREALESFRERLIKMEEMK